VRPTGACDVSGAIRAFSGRGPRAPVTASKPLRLEFSMLFSLSTYRLAAPLFTGGGCQLLTALPIGSRGTRSSGIPR